MMAFPLACRRAHVHICRTKLQGSIATLSTHVTSSSSSADALRRTGQREVTLCVLRNRRNFPGDASASSSSNSDIFLSGIFSKLSLSPAEATLTREYILPSASPTDECVNILDPVPSALVRDCPTSVVREIMERPLRHWDSPIEAPPPIAGEPTEKRAKGGIMKIRKKKMKKHQYIKWKKRNKFKRRAMFMNRREKKRKLWEARLDGYRFKGLTQEHVERHMERSNEEAAIFLRHLGIPLEEETPELIEQRRESEQRRAKKIKTNYLPGGTLRVTPTPILPEGASLRRVLIAQEQRAREMPAEPGEKQK